VLVLLPLVLAVGCPPRELTIDITEQGITFVTSACDKSCSLSLPLDDYCCAPTPRPTSEGQGLAFAAQLGLVERDGDARILRATTVCLRPGLKCFDLTDDEAIIRCMALEIEDLLDAAIREDGLSYDGMDPDRTDVIMGVFASPVGGPPVECVTDQLMACAGLEASSEEPSVYRIVCATCGDNPAVPADRFDLEAVPCFGACFTESCRDLFANGIL